MSTETDVGYMTCPDPAGNICRLRVYVCDDDGRVGLSIMNNGTTASVALDQTTGAWLIETLTDALEVSRDSQ